MVADCSWCEKEKAIEILKAHVKSLKIIKYSLIREMKPEVNKIKSTVFENFTKITLDDENTRLNGAATLIQHLEKSSEEKVNKST